MVIVQKPAFKSFYVLDTEGVALRIDEGMNIQFATETGEKVVGKLSKIVNKGKNGCKTDLQIIPPNSQKEEIWSVVVMAEGSLSIIEE